MNAWDVKSAMDEASPWAPSGNAQRGRLDGNGKTISDVEYLIGMFIVARETGGTFDPTLICYNYDKPDGKPSCSATPLPAGTPGTQRGRDRGWWQINDKAWPAVTDAQAFDPKQATKAAYAISKGWTDWSAWGGISTIAKQTTDPKYAPLYKTVKATFEDAYGTAIDDTPILSQIDSNANAVPDAVETVIDWTKALGKLLSVLLSLDFWRRVGLFVLGAALVYIAAKAVLF